jgi:hypothetical protein
MVILSFLKREHERTVNIFHYWFLGVPDRSTLQPLTVWTVSEKLRNGQKVGRSETVKNVGRSETIAESRSRYVHVHASKTKESLK